MIVKVILGFVVGFAGHYLFYDMAEKMPAPELARRGIGVLITWPVFSLMCRQYDADPSFILSFFSVGLGVATARFRRTYE